MISSHRAQASKGPTAGDVIQTPRWLADEMVRLLPLESWLNFDSGPTGIFDPCAGDDGILLKAALDLAEGAGELIATGCEIREDPRPKRAGVSMIGYGIDFFSQFPPKRKFDFVIMNPPFSGNRAWHFLKAIVEDWITSDGAVVSVVPNYLLDNSEGRKPWLEKHLEGVYAIPKDTFRPLVPVLHGSVVVASKTGASGTGEHCRYGWIKRPIKERTE